MKRGPSKRLTMLERRVLVKAFAKEYQRGRKKDKGAILDGFMEATGYQWPLCRAAVAPFWPEGVDRQGCGGSGCPLSGPASETDLRWRSEEGFGGDLGVAGLSVWETTGGRFGADTDRLGETWRAEAERGGTGENASDQCGDDQSTAGARETKTAAETMRGYQAGDVAAPSSGRADVCGLGRGASGVCGGGPGGPRGRLSARRLCSDVRSDGCVDGLDRTGGGEKQSAGLGL